MGRANKYRYENALSSLRRDGTRVGNTMSLLPSLDSELVSLDGHRRTRNKRRRFGFQELLIISIEMKAVSWIIVEWDF